MRVFAGPNGSGKSTIIQAVRSKEVKGIPVDFGIYINADDIAQSLKKRGLSLRQYKVNFDEAEFIKIASESGLIHGAFNTKKFVDSYQYKEGKIILTELENLDRIAQIIADYLRKRLLIERRKFSFETVFSHASKLDIMRAAKDAGYKVYLYFVSTESPEINKYRVQSRAAQGGHDVPKDRIESRYFRSLDFLYEATELAYQVYFFDNSKDGENFTMFNHFKLVQGKKEWDETKLENMPDWFIKYFYNKQEENLTNY